jgi:hypothetical protein
MCLGGVVGGAFLDGIDDWLGGERERVMAVCVAVYNLECVFEAWKRNSQLVAGHGGWSGGDGQTRP